jgi:hypothetical protein
MDILRTLARSETSAQLRRLALRSSGIYLSPFLLVDARTGKLVGRSLLRALLATTLADKVPVGMFGRLYQSVLGTFWNRRAIDQREYKFELHFRARVAYLSQRRTTARDGKVDPRHELRRLRARLLQKDPVLRGPAAVLVLFDSLGHERSSQEEILAARYAVARVYGATASSE